MSLDVKININSLQMIREELIATIQQSATDFESYMADQQSSGHIVDSAAGMRQVGGTFRLLEYPGAALLADEASLLIQSIADSQTQPDDNTINALTNAFFLLPRYIEYVLTRQSELPILVIPAVNELRLVAKQPLLPEHHFSFVDIPASISTTPAPVGKNEVGELLTSIGRLRHMYQTGLLGIIKQQTPGPHYYRLMFRSMSRIASMLRGHDHQLDWRLAAAVIECFARGSLSLTINRKRNLASVEKMLRQVVNKGEEGLDEPIPETLKKEFLFLLLLSGFESPEVNILLDAYGLSRGLGIDDQELTHQREVMYGPSQDAIESVIKVLKEELYHAKDILEIASQNNSIDVEDYTGLKNILSRVVDTLMVLNLSGPREILKQQLDRTLGWSDRIDALEGNDFLEAADAVLFVESALSGIDRGEITVVELNEANALTRQQIIASSQLAEAEKLVLEEAEACIALAKRAITSYVDSNFDSAHIANVVTTLNTVRGGLHILGYKRAASVIKSSSDFVGSHLKKGASGNQRHQLLETLADALISLEYYLNELSSGQGANDKILEIAEESLAALGFAVDSSTEVTNA